MPDEREESAAEAGPDEPAEDAASSAPAQSDGDAAVAVGENGPDDGDADGEDADRGADSGSDESADAPVDSAESEPESESAPDSADASTDSASTPADSASASAESDAEEESSASSTESSAPMPTAAKNRPPAETGTAADNVGGISTPPDDEELPLADHIEEMVSRLAIVLLIGAAGTAIGLLWATQAIDIIWTESMPQASQRPPHLYHPLELWLTRIKVASLLGIMIALPMFVYQTYRFMRPGLYPHERKYYLAAVPTSVVLASIGMIFSYLLVLPVLFRYFTYYSEGSAEIQYALGETFNLIITLTAFLAIVFQIPLFIMLAVMMGVTTRRWLADKRLYFWAGFAGLAFAFTIDPTAMAAGLVAVTMIVLFEGTLALLKWTGVD